ncbi:MAG: hypothetical protein U9N85_13445 [Bacteroidota bacterium]|nr:hypothetical protein [Bacteroidota bacterium]
MIKRETWGIIAVTALSGLFLFVIFMMWLNGGNSKYWLAKKMKLGAAILTFTAVQYSCNPVATCYDPIQPNIIDFSFENDTIQLNLSEGNILEGKLYEREGNSFSFQISDLDSVLQTDSIYAADGDFDEIEETIRLNVDSETPDGYYYLDIFQGQVGHEDSFNIQRFNIHVFTN